MVSRSDIEDDLSPLLEKWDSASREMFATKVLLAATRMSRSCHVSGSSYDTDDIAAVATQRFVGEADNGKLKPYEDLLYSLLKIRVENTAREFSRREGMKKRRGTVSASTLADEDGRDLFVSHIDKCSHQPSDLISYVDGERLFRCLDDSEQHYIDLALKEFPPRNAAICRALYSPTTIDNIAAEFGVDERTVRRIGERAEIALRNLANTYQERNKSSDADAVIDLVQKLERVKAIRKSMNSARAYAQR